MAVIIWAVLLTIVVHLLRRLERMKRENERLKDDNEYYEQIVKLPEVQKALVKFRHHIKDIQIQIKTIKDEAENIKKKT